jgi:acyl-CoA thioesterase-1
MRIPRRVLLALPLAGCAAGPEGEAEACPPVSHPPIASPRLAAALDRPGGPLIVAIGSSSTAGAGASRPWRGYPAALERHLREALGRRVTVLNRGVGGEAADAMLARLQRDVIAEGPDLVIWQVGANAALRRMRPERFRRFLFQGLDRLGRAGLDVVLMDTQRAPRILARPGHADYDAILAEAAARFPSVALFSRGAMMDRWAAAGLPNAALLAADGLHHNDRGYDCIARALAEALIAGLGPPATLAGAR